MPSSEPTHEDFPAEGSAETVALHRLQGKRKVTRTATHTPNSIRKKKTQQLFALLLGKEESEKKPQLAAVSY